jgi:hypothetical protein
MTYRAAPLLALHLNARFSEHSSRCGETLSVTCYYRKGGEIMERRHFLKLTFGFVAGATALAASANAAPLAPHPFPEAGRMPPANSDVQSAVTTADEVDRLKPEQVRWGHHWHRHWHRRRWGWRRHHWHRRHWHRHRW